MTSRATRSLKRRKLKSGRKTAKKEKKRRTKKTMALQARMPLKAKIIVKRVLKLMIMKTKTKIVAKTAISNKNRTKTTMIPEMSKVTLMLTYLRTS